MPTYCGVDFHSWQQFVAWCDTNDGEICFLKLDHSDQEKVREFYTSLPEGVIVGLEACGYSQWFEDLLFEHKIEIRIGNASEIRKRARSRQKTDRRDAELILDLLLRMNSHRSIGPMRNLAPFCRSSDIGIVWCNCVPRQSITSTLSPSAPACLLSRN